MLRPEDIPLTIVYEDDDLAVVDKPAGMMVHAGSGGAEHNRGTLVNALLFHFGGEDGELSSVGGALRPGIVHRLDKQTSGLIVVAKNDVTHRSAGRDVFGAAVAQDVYCAGAWRGEGRGRDDPAADLPRPGAADTHDDQAGGRAKCGVALEGVGAGERAVREVHAAGGAD